MCVLNICSERYQEEGPVRVPQGVQSAQDCPGAVLFTSQGSTDLTQKLPSCLKKCQERKRKPHRVRTGWPVDSAAKVKATDRDRNH